MKISVDIKISGLGVVLTIIFVVLKLTRVIDWGWFYCFLPLIISAGLALLLFLIAAIIMFWPRK